MLSPNSSFVVVLLNVVALASAAEPASAAAVSATPSRGDLEIVDCLLPGQVRSLGNRTYLTQRRPTRTTASDCRIRGGEYVSYDRADLKSALNVWLETAEQGDAEAQTNVGEIYERGLGGEPDLALAAEWYQKAADQRLPRALVNLGSLYERGLGVAADPLRALNLYRQAAGIKDNDLLYEDAVNRETERLRSSLQTKIEELQQQITVLESQVDSLEQKLSTASNTSSAEVRALRSLVATLSAQQTANRARLESLPPVRTPAPSAPVGPLLATASDRAVAGLKLGRFYALVIGNQTYASIESLKTPITDAQRAAQVLRDQYGFSVQVLQDADDVKMLVALESLSKVLRPEDNLLIYYAGHGARIKARYREAGYWLPVNAAAPPSNLFWLSNEQVTAHLARLPARRVLVVADSCYAGLLSDDPSLRFVPSSTQETIENIRYKLPKRARLLISSGGDRPVLDQGGAGHSVFSRAFLDILSSNQGVLSAPTLFSKLKERVRTASEGQGFSQVPELKSIRDAGHEIGDFFFVPKTRQ